MTALVWGLWDQNISPNHIIDSSYVLCYAAKWLGDEDIYFDSVHRSKPKAMLKSIHELLDEADVAIHYNGRRFDIPVINKEFLLHKLLPPAPYKQIDLLQVVKSNFKFPSNKLDYVAQRLGLGKKVEHEGMSLWTKCMNGDKDAWKRMEDYNIQDVVLLENLYNNLLPWIKNHPNQNLYADAQGCPTCGHHHLQKRGTAVSTTGTYQRYQCKSCGSWSQGAKVAKKVVEVKQYV
jgi:hypothetical protein